MQKIFEILKSPNKTLLCVGPLTINIVDSVLEFSKEYKFPLCLIASRRQIESEQFGGGYVNNWNTRSFSSWVEKQNNEFIYLARDHGGPWQSPYESSNNLNIEKSMASAKKSFEEDIDCGFQFIHIDPSVPIGNEKLTSDIILKRLFELYGHVAEHALKTNKTIHIELGTEEQSGELPDLENFEDLLRQASEFAKKNKYPLPLFVVAQTGTKVLEMRNVGVFETQPSDKMAEAAAVILECAHIAKKYGCYIKEHNADYLSTNNLSLRPSLEIKGANLAPELAIVETQSFLNLLQAYGHKNDFDEFVEIVEKSNAWKKWMAPRSTANSLDKAIIAGHYCQTDPKVLDIKSRLEKTLKKNNIDLNTFLKKNIKATLHRYSIAFGHLNS